MTKSSQTFIDDSKSIFLGRFFPDLLLSLFLLFFFLCLRIIFQLYCEGKETIIYQETSIWSLVTLASLAQTGQHLNKLRKAATWYWRLDHKTFAWRCTAFSLTSAAATLLGTFFFGMSFHLLFLSFFQLLNLSLNLSFFFSLTSGKLARQDSYEITLHYSTIERDG